MSYETIAQLARYWFVFLVFFILYRIVIASIREGKYQSHLHSMRQSGDFPECLQVIGLAHTRWPGWEGARFELYDDNIIGRGKSCDIQLPHNSLSAQHAHIYRQGRVFYIEDLGGKGGVIVNGGLMDSAVQWKLEDGDELQIGSVCIAVILRDGR